MLDAVRGSTLLVYEGAGHAVHWEEPVRFARDLTAFVDQFGNYAPTRAKAAAAA